MRTKNKTTRQTRTMVLLSILVVLGGAFVQGCASVAKKTQTRAPVLFTVPTMVVEAFCAKLRSEGIASDQQLYVVRTAQPLISGPSLRSLAHAYAKDGDVSGIAQALNEALTAVPVELDKAQSCAWSPIDKIDRIKQAQLTLIEFSAPFPNPFTRGESGVFARMSIGGHDAQWYWIPLAELNGQVRSGLVMPMDLHDG